MNSTKFGSKVKGFTLIEMIVVIAIIGILAGITSIFVSGFQRDARIETNNNKAHMVYTGFQDLLIQCEIDQDPSLFDAELMGGSVPTNYFTDDPMLSTEIYFRITDAKVSDKIAVRSRYKTKADKEVIAERGSTTTKAWYKKLETAILSAMDNSFEGLCAVYIDYENYVVKSAFYFESGDMTDKIDLSKLNTDAGGIGELMDSIDKYAAYIPNANDKKAYRMLSSYKYQKECAKYKGIYFGAYPSKED